MRVAVHADVAPCVSAVNLSLKVITHYSEFSTHNVNKYSKPYWEMLLVHINYPKTI
jgi:hypothetical protein